ncbi:MAG TPA: FAD-binding oxidoreductase [Steroidobacteraceae bacterium]|nr:FAD-binding oxidoreductase [Steroidobacteraceae bacterium]
MSAQPGTYNTSTTELAQTLAGIVGRENVVTDGERIEVCSVDFSEIRRATVAVIVRPTERAQVPRIMQVAHAARTPVVVRGGGMSYTLGYLPERPGSLMIDMSALNRVIEVNLPDMYITVEPGCTWSQLYRVLDGTGCHLPFGGTMSGMVATVGGALGNNATAVKRGEVVDCVLGLEVVLADGQVIQTGARATGRPVGPMQNYGPDLTGLFLHDAGVMGVKTQVTLSIERRPGGSEFAMFGFQHTPALIDAMCALSRQGLVTENGAFGEYHNQVFANEPAPAREEIRAMARAVMAMAPTRLKGLKWLAQMARPGGLKFLARWKHCLFVSTDAYSAGIARAQMRAIRALVREHGGKELPPTLSIAMRAMPFHPVERLIVGAGRENNTFPSNRLTGLSRAHELYGAAESFFAENRALMQHHGIRHTVIIMCVHNNMFGIEPIIYWRDQMSPLRASILSPKRRAELLAIAPDPAARAAALDLRQRLTERLSAIAGAHYQIGKFYPYQRDLVDEPTRAALLGIKRLLDPHGLLNPGGLGL